MSTKPANNPIASLHFEQGLRLLGIKQESFTGSFTEPVKIFFKNTQARDAYLRFMQSAPEKHASFPLELNSYNAKEVIVTPEQPLIIEPEPDGKPSIVNIGTLILEPGGQIRCKCTVF